MIQATKPLISMPLSSATAERRPTEAPWPMPG